MYEVGIRKLMTYKLKSFISTNYFFFVDSFIWAIVGALQF